MRALATSGAGALAVVAGVALPAWANAPGANARHPIKTGVTAKRFILDLPQVIRADYRPLHLAVPVLRLGIAGPEDFEVPFAAAPGLDHFRRDHVHQDLRERPPL